MPAPPAHCPPALISRRGLPPRLCALAVSWPLSIRHNPSRRHLQGIPKLCPSWVSTLYPTACPHLQISSDHTLRDPAGSPRPLVRQPGANPSGNDWLYLRTGPASNPLTAPTSGAGPPPPGTAQQPLRGLPGLHHPHHTCSPPGQGTPYKTPDAGPPLGAGPMVSRSEPQTVSQGPGRQGWALLLPVWSPHLPLSARIRLLGTRDHPGRARPLRWQVLLL